MKMKTVITLLLSLALAAVLAGSAGAALPDNDTLGAGIRGNIATDVPFGDAVSITVEGILRDAMNGVTGTLDQAALDQLVFDIAKRCRELQDAGVMGTEILFESVFAGLLNGSTAAQGRGLTPDISALEVAAMNGWGLNVEPEAFERGRAMAFQIVSRNRAKHNLGDIKPASPQ
jgi:hypothetical protein